jgi:hypothetical protein
MNYRRQQLKEEIAELQKNMKQTSIKKNKGKKFSLLGVGITGIGALSLISIVSMSTLSAVIGLLALSSSITLGGITLSIFGAKLISKAKINHDTIFDKLAQKIIKQTKLKDVDDKIQKQNSNQKVENNNNFVKLNKIKKHPSRINKIENDIEMDR